MASEHSPLPWRTVPSWNDIYAADGRSIADVDGSANAEFIVRCVNSHDDLLAALKWLAGDMDRAGGDGYGMPECPWCRAQDSRDGDDKWHQHDCELLAARAAIKKAEGR